MSPILGIIASGNFSPAGAYESIATAAGSGSSSLITFSSIPSTYQHLQLRFIAKSTDTSSLGAYTFTMEFNNDQQTNYARHALRGDGTGTAASGTATQAIISSLYGTIPSSNTSFANQVGVGVIDIYDYVSTAKNKTVRGIAGMELNRTTAPLGTVNLFSGLWYKTPEAITDIRITLSTGSFTTTTSFALYGIKGQ